MIVPFFDMVGHLASLRVELAETQDRIVNSGFTILGPELESFEQEYASYCGAKYCVGVGNGLEALALTLKARGIGPGDEVIVPSQTFIATWLAVSMVGAKIVPVEVEVGTSNLNPLAVNAALSSSTAAIIPVHLYGLPCDMSSLRSIADDAGLFLLEDAAQAHGARWHNRRIGSWGDAAAFSFYPSKNLGALGDGGAIVTNDEDLARRIRRFRNYGSDQKYFHAELGVNSRLDELQAGFLRAKLPRLDSWNDRRREIALRYTEVAQGAADFGVSSVSSDAHHVYHLYVMRTQKRDELQRHLQARGIATQIHYPVPPHLQQCYANMGFSKGAFPVAETLAQECLSLPIWPQMSDDQVAYVTAALTAFDEGLD